MAGCARLLKTAQRGGTGEQTVQFLTGLPRCPVKKVVFERRKT